MGGLRKFLPITFCTMLLANLSMIGVPFFSGFYSKDLIIAASKYSTIPGSSYAYFATLTGVFITSLYSFRMTFLVFQGSNKTKLQENIHEPAKVITIPLILLAIPSVIAGMILTNTVLSGFFAKSIEVLPNHPAIATITEEYHGFASLAFHGFLQPAFWMAVAGFIVAWLCYIRYPMITTTIKQRISIIYRILIEKYGFDILYQKVIAAGVRGLAWILWQLGDIFFIDGLLVNGVGKSIKATAVKIRNIQSGYLYHYAFIMIVGLLILLAWLVWY